MLRKLRITVAGKAYEVEVEVLDAPGRQPSSNPLPPAPVSSASDGLRPIAASGTVTVPSPLAGKVVSISVNPGDHINQGQTVIVLEAMKMNTLVTAQTAGTVSQILVKPGDAVDEGQALITIG